MLRIDLIISYIKQFKFDLSTESILQKQIEDVFKNGLYKYEREFELNKNDRPDFFIDGIAIEVKIKGSAKAIYKQCERYCKSDKVRALILVTNKTIGFPKEINGKPCYLIQLGKAWL